MPTVSRQRRCRARRKQGLLLLRVECAEYRFIAALLRAGRLTEAEALCRANVELAAAQVLADFIEYAERVH
jgi:hypothetical protein